MCNCVSFAPHLQIWQRGRLWMMSALELLSRLPLRPTGTREWRSRNTPRCHWKPQRKLWWRSWCLCESDKSFVCTSPVLSAKYVEQVGVCVFALYCNVAGWIAVDFSHNAKAVNAGHLDRRGSAAQPGEKPFHLICQVVWETHRDKFKWSCDGLLRCLEWWWF